jgi:hypothetical protein
MRSAPRFQLLTAAVGVEQVERHVLHAVDQQAQPLLAAPQRLEVLAAAP